MHSAILNLALLFLTAFSLATWLEPWHQSRPEIRERSGSMLAKVMGDGRRLFANHFYAKADAYFHSGNYPSFLDLSYADRSKSHLATGGSSGRDEEIRADAWRRPKDWLDAFSRNFRPTLHRHLGDARGAADGPQAEARAGEEREVLPWLKISASLNPEDPEAYVMAAFWLRRMNQTMQAEKFLREGLRAIPNDCRLLFELGAIYLEDRHDPDRTRNLWELALAQYKMTEATKPEPDKLLVHQILVQLAKLEADAHRYAQAIEYWKQVMPMAPNKQSVQAWIDELTAKLPP
jgi:tetratricopeptide (TPR) repeat protein